MNDPILREEPTGPGVVTLTLNRPDRRNALTIALMDALCEAIKRHEADTEARVLILRGAGPVFCAGLDLEEASDPSTAERGAEGIGRLVTLLARSSLATIAAAHGAAMAGGAGLLAACDFAIAADGLRIGFPEVRRGLVPAVVATVLRRKVAEADLRSLLLLAEPIDAVQARAMGLVHRAVPADRLEAEANALADLILEGAPEAVRETKRLLDALRLAPADGEADVRIAREFHERARHGDEAREGLAAFLEKRPPRWSRTTEDRP